MCNKNFLFFSFFFLLPATLIDLNFTLIDHLSIKVKSLSAKCTSAGFSAFTPFGLGLGLVLLSDIDSLKGILKNKLS